MKEVVEVTVEMSEVVVEMLEVEMSEVVMKSEEAEKLGEGNIHRMAMKVEENSTKVVVVMKLI